jgi:hypothetical protein
MIAPCDTADWTASAVTALIFSYSAELTWLISIVETLCTSKMSARGTFRTVNV